MEGILNFVVDNYVMFLTASILLVFALIGYFVDVKRRKSDTYKATRPEEVNLETLEVKENIALSEAVGKNKSVGAPEQMAATVNQEPVNPSVSNETEVVNNNQNLTQ